MLVSIDWIKDFVDLPSNLSDKEIESRFTLATAEVEDVKSVGDHFEKIRVVEIVEIEKHPDADKLNLVTFKVSSDETRKVVCGAGNVRVGIKIPYAPLGTVLPNGLVLEPKKIRGILSEGMLCSEEELGYAESSEGLMELDEDAPIGVNLIEYFNENKDTILDIDNKSLTHRPDLWGHFGLAREFAAIYKLALKNKFGADWSAKMKSYLNNEDAPVNVDVDLDSSCKCYSGLSIQNVKVADSPDWLKRRLTNVGLRPINNIVDISNYVMLELGHPLHIFDRSTINGDTLYIKRFCDDTEFVTLENENKVMNSDDTAIFDSKEALSIAGIKGGLRSGVTESTKDIFIEVANWKAADVRKTSARIGLRTDASQRFEKTLDSKLCERTILRTLDLILDVCPEAKVVGNIVYDGENLEDISDVVISTSNEKINSVLGTNISQESIVEIFESLDFRVKEVGDILNVTVPSYRATKDVEIEADLIEEIGRIVGYDNIKPVAPQFAVSPVKFSEKIKLHRKIRDFMVYSGKAFEIMTYSMVGKKLLKKASWESDTDLKILNPMSNDAEIMRPSLLPGLLESVAKNQKNFGDFRCFELGRCYRPDKKDFAKEESVLAVVHYSKDKNCFMDLLNSVESLLRSSNIPSDISKKHPKFKNEMINDDWKGAHPHEFLNIRIMGKMKGVVASIHPIMLRSFKIKGNVSVALIDLTMVESKEMKDKTKYQELSKFPKSIFDYTVTLKKDNEVSQLFDVLKKVKIKELTSNSVVDVYVSEDSSDKHITLRSTFEDKTKTLGGDLLKQYEEKIIAAMDKAGFPLKTGA